MYFIKGVKSHISNATELADAYYSTKDVIYRADVCNYNNTEFVEKYRDRFPELIDNILFVNLFYENWTQTITGVNTRFPAHVFLMVWDTDQYYVLDYDLQSLLTLSQPLVKVPARDYLARILNTDRTVEHLNDLLANPDKKSKHLPLFRLFTVDEWNKFHVTAGTNIRGLGREYYTKNSEYNNKDYNPDLIPALNFYEYMEFLKESSPKVENLKEKYDNATVKDYKEVLSNVRLTTEQIQDFLKLLKNYPLISHAEQKVLSVEEQNTNTTKSLSVKQEEPVKQADPNSKNEDGKTALMQAIENNDIPRIQIFLQTPEINVLAKNNQGLNALMLAIKLNNTSIVAMLLQTKKFDISMRFKHKINALSLAEELKNPEMLALVKNYMRNLDERYENESLAVRLLNIVDEVDNIIQSSTLTQNRYSWDLERKNLQVNPEDTCAYQALLKKLTEKDEDGNSCNIILPGYYGAEILDFLLQVPGMDINDRNGSGISLLMCQYGDDNSAMAHYLLGIPGINVNIKDFSGNTPLIRAVKEGSIEVIKELLKVPEIDIFATNRDKLSALDIASTNRDEGAYRIELEPGSYYYQHDMEYREKFKSICELIQNQIKVLQNRNNGDLSFFRQQNNTSLKKNHENESQYSPT